jgi:hypothetical protein
MDASILLVLNGGFSRDKKIALESGSRQPKEP